MKVIFFSLVVAVNFLSIPNSVWARGDDMTNQPPILARWLSISNRWGSVPLEGIQQAAKTNEVTAQFYLGSAYWDGLGVWG
jgi:hypothetical protein